MMGTSLLAMPWAIRLSGLVAGPAIAIVLGAIALYTAIIILKVHKRTCRQLALR
jgi:sodium-coupled neutral amino acid transporter 9